MYDVRRMYDLPLRGISDLRGGQSSIQEKRTREDALFRLSFPHGAGTVGVKELFERGDLFEQLLAFIGVADPHAFTGSGVLSFGR